MNNILIVGTTIDGPVDYPIKANNFSEILNYFKADFRERFTLTNTATSQALSFTPFNTVTAYGSAYGENTLYSVYASGSTTIFGTKGGDTEVVDFRYIPYTGQSDIITAARTAGNLGAGFPWVARIAGEVATGTLNNWVFKAKYSGSIYNTITITYAASTLTITGSQPRFPKLQYTYTDNSDLATKINQDYTIGACPVYVKTIGDNFSSTGTVTLNGGTDGSFTTESITNFLQNSKIPNFISQVVFLTEVTSGIIDVLANRLEDNRYQPRIYYMAAPNASSLNMFQYATHIASALPERHNMLGLIHGTAEVNYNQTIKTRYLVEPAILNAALRNPISLTNMPIGIDSFSPVLSKQDLDLLFNQGIMAPVRTISNGTTIYKAVSSTANEDFILNMKRAQAWAILYTIARPYLHTNMEIGSKPEIASQMRNGLSAIPGVRVIATSAFVQKNFTTADGNNQGLPYINLGYVLEIDAQLQVAKELLTINFTVRVG